MERFILQPADRKEAEKAMALIDEAKEFLKSQGIDQWQTGYGNHHRRPGAWAGIFYRGGF